MSWMNELKREFRKYEERQYKYGDRAPLSEADVDSFITASETKPNKKVVSSKEDIISHMKKSNWVRYRRLQKDYKWLQGRMRELGLNPEEARWIL